MTDVFRDFSIGLKWMNEAFYCFCKVGRTKENFGEDNHFSVFTVCLRCFFSRSRVHNPIQPKMCGSGLRRWHFLPWFSVSLASCFSSQASAASPMKWVGLSYQLWLLSDLAHLAAVWHLLFICVLLFEGGSCLFLCYSVRLGLIFHYLFFVDK